MSALLRLNGSLRDATVGKPEYVVDSGRTVRETLVSLGIEPLTVAQVIVKKQHGNKDHVIRGGDEVLVMAEVGGG